jgi:hypothetical protein
MKRSLRIKVEGIGCSLRIDAPAIGYVRDHPELIVKPYEAIEDLGRDQSSGNVNDLSRVKGCGIITEPVIDIPGMPVIWRAGKEQEQDQGIKDNDKSPDISPSRPIQHSHPFRPLYA